VASARDQMKMIEEELRRVRAEIERLRIEEALLSKMHDKMSGVPEQPARGRAMRVKPVVLDIMKSAGAAGATSAEVDLMVRERVPNVAKDTVGSILSRLKGDGALVYDGERYYEKRFDPEGGRPFEPSIRAVT